MSRYWPRTAGWHRLASTETQARFYVAGRENWPAWRDRRAIEATARRAVLGDPAGDLVGRTASASRPFQPLGFFILLLVSLATVWADDQWRSSDPARQDEGRSGAGAR